MFVTYPFKLYFFPFFKKKKRKEEEVPVGGIIPLVPDAICHQDISWRGIPFFLQLNNRMNNLVGVLKKSHVLCL